MGERQSHKQLRALRTGEAPTQLSPSRSRTDPPAPQKQQHEKSHLHKRLHSNTLRHRAFTSSKEHSHRESAKEIVQSAIDLKPPISFDSLLRRDKKSPDSSRRGSHLQQQQQQQQRQQDISQTDAEEARRAAQRRVRPEDVTKARRENARREEHLRESLKNVEEVAMSSTRQLDDTYYSILEKASLLRSTVASLQQLAEESKRMHSTFKEDTTKLEQETKQNLDGFNNFDGQEKTINDLVVQLRTSKDRTGKLNERLEAARNRIEAYEHRWNEHQKKRRKNWGIIWASIIGLVAFMIAVIAAKNRSTVGSTMHQVAKVLDAEIASPIAAALRPTSSPAEDPYLRKLFDEL
ncbi:hypothetical protein CLAFUW4_01604 [Fulvia fulva]|uniref:Uncharacterized protein n=1 Tax=Passalora fulva TaxID=5499 RepID=A0A9Q8L6A3_PASFU|nr:uncharacterized protein CLAFUR5_01604 [Fulvia fulva]KAK4635656.1 hypothetical protein CLAFUR4_01602 [Fulvia fulva]KAK4637191.1 hypothetical protein CLAFUR0_01603 [Fulvia fulva]UJO11647.1 hypothetical protein CLAFUR5_01604 [Fulvia fulva]WPV08155.1 hypothetical protein CLAFUW4_01604 [Fulvia fulva]WPV23755.1 hypothetical protein CLAFUW7_01606 [Fulvia fulva]